MPSLPPLLPDACSWLQVGGLHRPEKVSNFFGGFWSQLGSLWECFVFVVRKWNAPEGSSCGEGLFLPHFNNFNNNNNNNYWPAHCWVEPAWLPSPSLQPTWIPTFQPGWRLPLAGWPQGVRLALAMLEPVSLPLGPRNWFVVQALRKKADETSRTKQHQLTNQPTNHPVQIPEGYLPILDFLHHHVPSQNTTWQQGWQTRPVKSCTLPVFV